MKFQQYAQFEGSLSTSRLNLNTKVLELCELWYTSQAYSRARPRASREAVRVDELLIGQAHGVSVVSGALGLEQLLGHFTVHSALACLHVGPLASEATRTGSI